MSKGIYLNYFLLGAALLFFSCYTNGEKSSKTRPNILFAIGDDISYPHMSAYGCAWVNTPAFDRIAKEGLLFNNAYTPNAKCAPSRSIILTGRNSWQLEEAANHWPYFPSKFQSIWEALQELGYFTGHTAKGWSPGVPGEIEGRKRELTGPAFNRLKLQPPTAKISSNDYAANFSEFLDQKPKDQPFCFWYGSLEPHRAYEYGTGAQLGGKKTSSIDRVFNFFPDNDTVRNDLLDYAFEIEHFDQHLNRMLAKLESMGELENTLIIATSDNGMPFPRVKGQAYEHSNHLPLAIRWGKGINNPGRVIEEFISFTDFAPTLLDVADVSLEHTRMSPFEGQSLVDLFTATRNTPAREYIILGKERHDVGRPDDGGYPIRGLINDDYLFLMNFEPGRWPSGNPETGYLNCDGSATKTAILHTYRNNQNSTYWDLAFGIRHPEELYDLNNDQDCVINLAGNPKFAEIQQLLKTELLNELHEQKDPRILGEGHIFDEYAYSDTSHSNFYERWSKGLIDASSTGWVNLDDYEPEIEK